MEEQKTENKEEAAAGDYGRKRIPIREILPQEATFCGSSQGGYLVYTGYRLCANVISGAEDSSTGFLVAGGIFVVIGAVLLIMAVRNLAKAGAQKHEMEEAATKKSDRGNRQRSGDCGGWKKTHVYCTAGTSGRES